MTAVRAQITALVLARMQALAGAAEVELMPTADPIQFPARHIFDHGQQVVDGESGNTTYRLRVTVEQYFEEAGGPETYAAANEGYAQVVAAMVSDPPMEGLAETVDEADTRIIVAPLASQSRLCVITDFDIQFATRREDPTQAA